MATGNRQLIIGNEYKGPPATAGGTDWFA